MKFNIGQRTWFKFLQEPKKGLGNYAFLLSLSNFKELFGHESLVVIGTISDFEPIIQLPHLAGGIYTFMNKPNEKGLEPIKIAKNKGLLFNYLSQIEAIWEPYKEECFLKKTEQVIALRDDLLAFMQQHESEETIEYWKYIAFFELYIQLH